MKIKLWIGYILSMLSALVMIASGVSKVMKVAPVVASCAHFGFDVNIMTNLGFVEIACAVIYLIPRTSILGAILLTGYLGGATAITLRVGDPFIFPVIVGVLAWVGLYLRDQRLPALIPLKS